MTNNDFMSKLKDSYGYDDIKPAIVDGKESNDLFKVAKNGLQKYIRVDLDTIEVSVESIVFSGASNFVEDIAIIYDEDGWYSLIGVDLNIKADCYREITRLSNDLFIAKGPFGYGVINSEGAIVIACLFDKITYDEARNKFEVFEIA